MSVRIRFASASKRYWSEIALDDVSLTIEPGAIVAVLGTNGAGKSTLLRCLATQLMLTHGDIFIDETIPLLRSNYEQRKRLHFVPDTPNCFPNLDLISQIVATLDAYSYLPDGIDEKISQLLTEFSLLECEYKSTSELSRGQRYKAALTSLIALDRELWLVDEPFASGMDPLGIKTFKRHAKESACRGNTIIYTTQILEVVESFADQVIVLNRGKLAAFGSLQEIKESSRGEKSLQGLLETL